MKILCLLIVSSLFVLSCNKEGCTDPSANNYNEKAKEDDGSCTYSDTGSVQIWDVVAFPDFDEAVTIKNTMETVQDIGGWQIGDEEFPNAYAVSSGFTLAPQEEKTWSAAALGISINDSKETIFLKDDQGVLQDSWEN
jgi:hypothetical protein